MHLSRDIWLKTFFNKKILQTEQKGDSEKFPLNFILWFFKEIVFVCGHYNGIINLAQAKHYSLFLLSVYWDLSTYIYYFYHLKGRDISIDTCGVFFWKSIGRRRLAKLPKLNSIANIAIAACIRAINHINYFRILPVSPVVFWNHLLVIRSFSICILAKTN